MKRRGLLKGMLALPVASALGGRAEDTDRDTPKGREEKGILRVVLNGAFAIVVQKNSRNRLRVFSPKELSNLHEFYFNDPTRPESKNQTHNFELLPDGLELAYRPPEVDGRLAGFNVSTDLWCQDEYFVTIDLPAPRRITFMPPLHRAILATGAQIQVASTHILEYAISNPHKIRMVYREKETPPLYFADLVKRYRGICSEKGDERSKSECEQMKKRYEAGYPGSAPAYFFGVGLPYNHHDPDHAIQFFNQRILASFPHLAKRLELKSIDSAARAQSSATIDSSHLTSAVWRPEMQVPRVLQVSSVVDCTVSGPIVTHPAGSGG